MKTKEEIKALKENWLKDPCWDIETTEGFEKHKKELLIFRLQQEKKWLEYRLQKLESIKQSLKEFLGIDEILERLGRLES